MLVSAIALFWKQDNVSSAFLFNACRACSSLSQRRIVIDILPRAPFHL